MALTPKTHEAVIERLASGSTIEVAAQAAGVARETVSRWLARGATARIARSEGGSLTSSQRVYLRFLQDAEQARSRVEVGALAAIQKAAEDGSWQAAAWYLEHVHPERYSNNRAKRASGGRPVGATSAPDRPSTAAPPPILRAVK